MTPGPLPLLSSRRSAWAILWIAGLMYSALPLMICTGLVLAIS